eukprot:PhM_4_TR12040/c0_g1_i1/m.44929
MSSWLWSKVTAGSSAVSIPSLYTMTDMVHHVQDKAVSAVTTAYRATTGYATPEYRIFCRALLACDSIEDAIVMCETLRRRMIDGTPHADADAYFWLLQWILVFYTIQRTHPCALAHARTVLASCEGADVLGTPSLWLRWTGYYIFSVLPNDQHVSLVNHVVSDIKLSSRSVGSGSRWDQDAAVCAFIFIRKNARVLVESHTEVQGIVEQRIAQFDFGAAGADVWHLRHAVLALSALVRELHIPRCDDDDDVEADANEHIPGVLLDSCQHILNRALSVAIGKRPPKWSPMFLFAYATFPSIPREHTRRIMLCLTDTRYPHLVDTNTTTHNALLLQYLQRHVPNLPSADNVKALLVLVLRATYRIEFTAGMQRAVLYHSVMALCGLAPRISFDSELAELMNNAVRRLVMDADANVQYVGQRCLAAWKNVNPNVVMNVPHRLHVEDALTCLPSGHRRVAARRLYMGAMKSASRATRYRAAHALLGYIMEEVDKDDAEAVLGSLSAWSCLGAPLPSSFDETWTQLASRISTTCPFSLLRVHTRWVLSLASPPLMVFMLHVLLSRVEQQHEVLSEGTLTEVCVCVLQLAVSPREDHQTRIVALLRRLPVAVLGQTLHSGATASGDLSLIAVLEDVYIECKNLPVVADDPVVVDASLSFLDGFVLDRFVENDSDNKNHNKNSDDMRECTSNPRNALLDNLPLGQIIKNLVRADRAAAHDGDHATWNIRHGHEDESTGGSSQWLTVHTWKTYFPASGEVSLNVAVECDVRSASDADWRSEDPLAFTDNGGGGGRPGVLRQLTADEVGVLTTTSTNAQFFQVGDRLTASVRLSLSVGGGYVINDTVALRPLGVRVPVGCSILDLTDFVRAYPISADLFDAEWDRMHNNNSNDGIIDVRCTDLSERARRGLVNGYHWYVVSRHNGVDVGAATTTIVSLLCGQLVPVHGSENLVFVVLLEDCEGAAASCRVKMRRPHRHGVGGHDDVQQAIGGLTM